MTPLRPRPRAAASSGRTASAWGRTMSRRVPSSEATARASCSKRMGAMGGGSSNGLVKVPPGCSRCLVAEVASREVLRVRADLFEKRPVAGANLFGERAAGMKRAAGRDVDRARRLAFDHGSDELDLVQARCGSQQRPGVGMARVPEDRFAIALLHDPPEVHDRDAVAQMAHDGQVVRDEHDRQTEPAAQVLEEPQDRGLHGDVEGGDRLVGDDHAGLHRERPGDGDPLSLAPGELARQAVEGPSWEADERHEL